MVGKVRVQELKEAGFEKEYEITIKTEKKITKNDIIAVKKLKGKIEQKTPIRVLHRRADLMRVRGVHKAEVVGFEGKTLKIIVRGDSGLYVKELVHGDEGRSSPSLSELMGQKLEVLSLDVTNIFSQEKKRKKREDS